ncbi:hypothetical protein [Actinokineospora globicatena]|uniref:Uncharacterized protein n=1 Tax=Actinokineospora globicatena TaxID=103729 RepID=A0A9W6V4K1_9PSEU|nr:hypothetical protein [Actinokineospora globicatena]GLW89285.1 hypothetical protein Aglo03_01010 [Actinokineospora globicatena]
MSGESTSPRFVDVPMPFRVSRSFSVDQYHRSHRQLLLRASPIVDGGERIDVLFRGVAAMQLPIHLPSLCVRVATEKEVRRELGDFEHVLQEDSRFVPFVVCEELPLGFVIAYLALTVTNNLLSPMSTLLYEYEATPAPEVIGHLV